MTVLNENFFHNVLNVFNPGNAVLAKLLFKISYNLIGKILCDLDVLTADRGSRFKDRLHDFALVEAYCSTVALYDSCNHFFNLPPVFVIYSVIYL